MNTSLDPSSLAEYLGRQLANFFPDQSGHDVRPVVMTALDRLEACFAPVNLRMYRRNGQSHFDHLHSDQYATFIYLASNVAFRRGDQALAAKLFGLNKALNGFMCMYDTVLPEHFLILHTVGMMLGKASYGDYFVAIHGVTVGTDRGHQPRLGQSVIMYGGSAVLGDCAIGDHVSIAANTLIRHESVPAAQVVVGSSPNLVFKSARRVLIDEFFDHARHALPEDSSPRPA